MRPDATPLPDGIDALESALRLAVAQRNDGRIRAARCDADTRLAEAGREAAMLLERARREGEDVTDALLTRERASLRRENVAIVLEARHSVVLELDAQVRAGVFAMREAPDYGSVVDALTTRARARLGADAVIVTDPDGAGGVIGELGGRRVDYTLTALAERACATLGDAIEELLQ